jgi:cytochrome c oxidase subunit 2
MPQYFFRSVIILLVFAASACTQKTPPPPAMTIKLDDPPRLFRQSACGACHSTDGSPGVGPTLRGLYGENVELSNGKTVVADEAYLRESIVEPNAKIKKGYPALMPKLNLSNEEVNTLVAYIKTLGSKETATQSSNTRQ